MYLYGMVEVLNSDAAALRCK